MDLPEDGGDVAKLGFTPPSGDGARATNEVVVVGRKADLNGGQKDCQICT